MKRLVRTMLTLLLAIATGLPVLAGAPLTGVDPLTGDERSVKPDGDLTHVVFFATWCPPCLAEFRALADLEARWEPDGYRLVLVAIAQRENAARLARFIADEQPPGQLLFDRSGKLQKRFGIDAVPGHVLLGADGVELFRASSLDEGVTAAVQHHLGSR